MKKNNILKNHIIGIFSTVLLVATSNALSYQEVPFFADDVSQNKLPVIAERLPENPLVTSFSAQDGLSSGEYGGQMRMLMGKAKDIRMMTVFGYARLVGYDSKLQLNADILESFHTDDFKTFTLKLRKGHKWSDGTPFTTADFDFFWQQVANDPDISPFGPPRALMVNNQPPKVEVIDALTITYSWDQPNRFFLGALAAPSPLYIYMPAHYLKQFHKNFVDDIEALEQMVDDSGASSWAGLFQRRSHQYKFDNPDLPVLQPWVNTTALPSDYFEFVRNPYFHRVDDTKKQLPYIDKVLISIVSSSLVPAKTGAGESDLQARYLRLDDYTFLKEREAQDKMNVYLWQQAKGSQVAIYPNLTTADLSWRPILRDKRFRAALSMGIDRNEINQVVYFGLAKEAGNTVLAGSEFGMMKDTVPYVEFNLAKANAILDEMGLQERNNNGLRMMPVLDQAGKEIDKQPMEVIVHSTDESTEESDVLELISTNWLKLGIKISVKPSQREVFYQRVNSGEVVMSVWGGVDNASPTVYHSPEDFVPLLQSQLQWSAWGNFAETNGNAGQAPDIDSANTLLGYYNNWMTAANTEESREAWHNILTLYNEEVFSIGTVNNVPTPVVVSKALNNVPSNGVYSWEPFSYFGVYRMDTFWFDETRR